MVAVCVVFALAAIAGIVLLVRLSRTRCPECRKGTLEIDDREHPGGIVPGVPSALMLRCLACAAEYRRDDKGPLIPKLAWDAGARDELPRATLKR